MNTKKMIFICTAAIVMSAAMFFAACDNPWIGAVPTPNLCANGHDPQPVAGEMEVAPTCEDEGFGKVACTRAGCDYTENGASIPALGHTGTVEPFAATCTIAGNSALSGNCVRFAQCSHVVTGAVIPASHSFTEWQETTPATCLEAAIDTEECGVCGELGTVTDEGHHALGHSAGEASGAIAATCETDGYTGGTGNCIRCAITITSGTVIPKWNHHYHDWTAPTCIMAGNSQRECVNDCGTIDTRSTGYAALGHEGAVAAFAATCTIAGNSASSGNCVRFAQCGHVVTGTVVPALGHTGSVAAFAATCTIAGNSALSGNCVRFAQCAHVVTGTVIAALGHTGTVAAFAATCTTAGNSALSGDCVRFAQCGHVVTGTPVPALGHDHGTSGTGSLICKRQNCDHQYAIGATGPAGGIIFYVASSGFTVQGYTGTTGTFAEYTAYYLEAAPANEPASPWGAHGTLIAGITTWGSIEAKDAGLAASIGVGRKDTQTIVNSAAFAALTDTAAQRCASKNFGGKTDWFLPSLGELNEMNKARVAGVTGIPTTGRFWSSSQYNNNFAWPQSLDYGNQDRSLKGDNHNVRAIRAF